jgi:hypothetical protein
MSEKMRNKENKSGSGVIAVIAGIAVLAGINHVRNDTNSDEASARPNVPSHSTKLHFDTTPKINRLANPLPNPKGDRQIDPQGITLHWWSYNGGGRIESLAEGLRKNKGCGSKAGCTVQYGITSDGEIYQMMESPTEYAQHASGANETSIGIEIEGKPEDFALKGSAFDQDKYEAVVSLTKYLVDKYDIPLNGPTTCKHAKGIHGHDEFNHCRNNGTTKEDVGPAYTASVKKHVASL